MSVPLSDVLLHFDQVLPVLIQQHGSWVYVLLFALIFLQIGIPPLFFLPGNPVLFVAGAMCASQGLRIEWVIPLFFGATVSASLLNYQIGNTLGHRLFTEHNKWVSPSALRKAHDFYESYGAYTFVLTPFIAAIRTFSPLAAGVAQMTWHKYLLSVSAGALLWSVSLSLAGYYFGNSTLLKQHLGSLLLLGLVLGLSLLTAAFLWRLRHRVAALFVRR